MRGNFLKLEAPGVYAAIHPFTLVQGEVTTYMHVLYQIRPDIYY